LAESGVEVLDVSAKRYQQGSILDASDQRPRAAVLADALAGKALVLGVGGIETPFHAETALSDGCALVGLGSVLLANPDWPRDAREGRALADPSEKPSSDTLVNLAVPMPVIRYLAKRGRLSDAS
jgi:2,4-dienoyl-CoA reductase-like NADH-dependent reductase (Old Yellow Enzyme family)